MPSLEQILRAGLEGRPHPVFPGAVAALSIRGQSLEPVVAGDAVRYADDSGTPVPQPTPMHADTIFDAASLTKLFTATAILTLVGDGLLELDRPVADTLPGWAGGERASVTLRHLLTHTSGLPAHTNLWAHRFLPDRIQALLHQPLQAPPATRHEYSCLGYITAGWIAERASGVRLPELIADRVCRPLGLQDTGYLPAPGLLPRIAATEYEPAVGRGIVHGSVHDENSWSLGGTAGNAGLFSTAADLLVFGELLAGRRPDVLAPELHTLMVADQLPPGVAGDYGQGFGPRIADRSFMGVLADSAAVGHTGFTGTSVVVDPGHELIVVLLSNRVHPSREWSELGPTRRAVAQEALRLATAVPAG